MSLTIAPTTASLQTCSPLGGFREYLDIFRAAWQLNLSRPSDTPPFLVLGMDDEWDQLDQLTDKNPKSGFEKRMAREKHLIRVVRSATFEKGQKAVVHVGRDHSITCQGERLGAVLSREYGDRLFQVVLHHEYQGRNQPAPMTSFLDAIFAESGAQPVGLDLRGSPFANLVDKECVYWLAVPSAGLADFAQGYVFLRPIADLTRVSWIDGFVDSSNFARALPVAEEMGWSTKGECSNPECLDGKMKKKFPK
jgi:hypothetical protein